VKLVAPNASPEEAAAIVAALERFMRDTAPAAAILEGVSRDPWAGSADAWLAAPGHTPG